MKKDPSGVKKLSNTKTAGKYKLWKIDYFREKDREAMADITKQLKKGRKKTKSSHMKMLLKSSSKIGAKPPPKSGTKPASKSSSKPLHKASSKTGTKYSHKPSSGVSRGKYRR